MKTPDEFFIPDNEVKLPDELDYSRVDEYIRSAEAFSRSTYQSVYIIDYFKQNFLYVSPNPMFLCGLSPEQMIELGYQFYLKYVPEDEQALLLDINRVGFAFHNQIPLEQRKDWYISYDFHILNDGHPILINHKLTSLALTSDGRIWLALCVVSASTHTTPGHIEMHHVAPPTISHLIPSPVGGIRTLCRVLPRGRSRCLHFLYKAIRCRRLPTASAFRPTPSRNTVSASLKNSVCATYPRLSRLPPPTSYSKFFDR